MKLHMTIEPADFAEMIDVYLEQSSARMTRASRDDVLMSLVEAFPDGIQVAVLPFEKPKPDRVKESEAPPSPEPAPDSGTDSPEVEAAPSPEPSVKPNLEPTDWDKEIESLMAASQQLEAQTRYS